MRIVFNSRREKAACTIFYRDAISRIPDSRINDFDNYLNFDIGLFMTYPEDLEELKKAKLANPQLKTAIVDPRNENVLAYIDYVDFLVVDSLEMYDFWTKAKLPIFQYVEYPDIEQKTKWHERKKKIIIGYHGNVIHLNCMADSVSIALDQLSECYDIEFHAIYNIKNQGKWEHGLPRKVKVKHIQWHENVYYDEMSDIDVGIVPAFMPTVDTVNYAQPKKKRWLWTKIKPVSFNFAKDDYLVRYKMPSNPGRIIVFGLMGIPVVSDFFPSAMNVIEDGKNGLLAASQSGWFCALEKLICNHELRQSFSKEMRNKIINHFDFNLQNQKFLNFINKEILV